MSRILQLTADNFKRLTAVHITPEGNVIRLAGENGAGKSSVLDAIAAALGGGKAQPEMPIRRGAKKAHVVVELTDLIVERTYTAAGSSLVVRNRDGAVQKTPQQMLDSLVGNLAFDPLAFTRMEPKQQAETLRRLVGLDFAALDEARRRLYEERTLVGRERDRLAAKAGSFKPEWAKLPEKPVDVAEASKRLAELLDERAAGRRHLDAIDAKARLVADVNARLELARRAVTQLETELAKLEADLRGMRSVKPIEDSEPAIADLTVRIKDAERINQQIRERDQYRSATAEHDASEKRYADLSAKINLIDERKTGQISGAEMPVPGLAFDQDGVTLNGVPLSQASTAEQLRTSVAIGLAQNPNLRVMLVRDAALLDEKSMRVIEELAAKHDAQLWVERVTDTSPSRIVIEDGTVVEKLTHNDLERESEIRGESRVERMGGAT